MPKVVDVVEYKTDGIAIIEDNVGKYVANSASTETTPVYDFDALEAWFGSRRPCALLQSREAMLT